MENVTPVTLIAITYKDHSLFPQYGADRCVHAHRLYRTGIGPLPFMVDHFSLIPVATPKDAIAEFRAFAPGVAFEISINYAEGRRVAA